MTPTLSGHFSTFRFVFLCARVSSGNCETMESLKIGNFNPKASESLENFNISNVGFSLKSSLKQREKGSCDG